MRPTAVNPGRTRRGKGAAPASSARAAPSLLPVGWGWREEVRSRVAQVLLEFAAGNPLTRDVRAHPASIEILALVQNALDAQRRQEDFTAVLIGPR